MKIQNNLFDLTPEQEQLSKTMYNGKVIKCLVAPYHSYNDLESIIQYTPTTYLFPEREASLSQLSQLISIIVNSDVEGEIRIITTNQNIITDMVDGCVRVLTQDGDIVECPIKTFMANIHDIRYSLMENKDFQSETGTTRPIKQDLTQELINEVKNLAHTTVSQEKYDKLKNRINMIGEDVIRNILYGHLLDINIK